MLCGLKCGKRCREGTYLDVISMDKLSHEDKLRLTVHSEVRKICQDVGRQIRMDLTEDAISVIAELAWKKMRVIGQDLEHFAKHAKRSTINAEDVKLLVRRNPSLATVCHMADDTVKKKHQNKEKDAEELLS